MDFSSVSFVQVLYQLGLNPKKTSASKGGEYHSPCPWCGGNDRFMIWQGQNRYYCRQCGKSGSLQYFLWEWFQRPYSNQKLTYEFKPKQPDSVELNCVENKTAWTSSALEFIRKCNQYQCEEFSIELKTRGITRETADRYQLGYNSSTIFASSSEWGLESDKKNFIPKGLVIPIWHQGKPCRIKIRKAEPFRGPKYIEIKGSSQEDAIFGERSDILNHPVMIVESELDAILLEQEAGDICSFIALGGASKKVTNTNMNKLQQNPRVLLSLDNDGPGKNAMLWWLKKIFHSKPWFLDGVKSPGNAGQKGWNLRKWVDLGLENNLNQP